ncbi:hypothetical protein LCER1_G006833 [Lachnellula cervina]|uniref:AAA+ ATPase lid domain-containing protein n=1 Tax=Lachnellula cervina TaxID=1316786 RepID=A0A7D8Z117_9HELO|nr:hypothetical protein LCER1_G006833 [Lachnellula cervina]
MASYGETLGRLIGNYEQPSAKVDNCVHSWTISGWSWKFDGTFSRIYSKLELSLEVHDKQEQSEWNINDLNLVPLAFADECLKQRLRKRGEMFWKCRFKYLVSYHDDDNHDLDCSADQRFMIDPMTYRELHKKQSELPKGKRKHWVDLQVDRMDEVVWNKKAFKSLVLAHKTKDLIQALISKQLDSEKSTDLIHGKGNGLSLLLDRGPGTGKTLTAEGVAEIAENSESWMICGGMRSNRVGTIDEAFKSRIQLALHYPKLDHVKRAKIWENFTERLKDLKEENINFNDLKNNIENLAKNKINGREIRNAITLARQYTQWKATKLDFAEMQDIIKISRQFDVYLSELNRNITQDQLAQEDSLRLAAADR